MIRNVVVAGHRTSVRLEPLMWDSLLEISQQLEVTVHDLVTSIDRDRVQSSLTAAIRVFIVNYYRTVARGGSSGKTMPGGNFRS